jgi:hypothetical protein
MENTTVKAKWYQTSWATILFLIFFFPVGLFLMWKYTNWPKVAKWVVTGFFGLMVLGNAVGGDSTKSAATTTQPTQATEVPTEPQTVNNDTTSPAPTKVTTKTITAPTQAKQSAPASNGTVSQSSALRKAKSYLAYTAFSHDGLVAQLEFEKFSHEDAVYGADNSGADWNQQAAKKAKSYMEQQGFSRDGLIQQLMFEKFTQSQAEYGANSVGL